MSASPLYNTIKEIIHYFFITLCLVFPIGRRSVLAFSYYLLHQQNLLGLY